MKTLMVIDQMGRAVAVPTSPQRIISLVPSQTELLFDLGLADMVVGVTKFCVHPTAALATKQSIGGTKQFRFEVIEALQPDLIIGNKEENYEAGIEQLAASYPVWMSDVKTLPQALNMITAVGQITGQVAVATSWTSQIEAAFASLRPLPQPQRVAYFIWQKPYMVAGADTFIDDLLQRCGFVNVFAGENGRYPQVTEAMITATNLDLMLLSSEPFPFKGKHQAMLAAQFPQTAVKLVDGELFSWYGSRLLKAVPYLQQFIEANKHRST